MITKVGIWIYLFTRRDIAERGYRWWYDNACRILIFYIRCQLLLNIIKHQQRFYLQFYSEHAEYFGGDRDFGWADFFSVGSEVCLKTCVQIVYSKTFKEGGEEHDGGGVIVSEIGKPSPMRNNVEYVCVSFNTCTTIMVSNLQRGVHWRIK